tara:strand:+ start:28849 stop:29037 length:189 start_codon:yes stop_codon:yes gene_type:complete
MRNAYVGIDPDWHFKAEPLSPPCPYLDYEEVFLLHNVGFDLRERRLTGIPKHFKGECARWAE